MNQHTRKFLVVLLSLLVILSIGKAFYFTEMFGGTDLRCRIVGSRLLLTNKSPYFYKWVQGDDITYLDPNVDPRRQTNGNAVTPALLLLNKPLAFFSYRWIRISWTLIQYCLFYLSVLFIWKSNDSRKDLLLPVTIILFGFLMSDIWFYNIERGQTYILYAFIFSCCYFFYSKKWKYNHMLAGAVAGISIWIRPLFLFINIPFLLVKDFKWFIGSVIGFSAGLLFFFIPLQKSWNDYRAAMTHYEREGLWEEPYLTTNDTVIGPTNIEGVSNLTLYKGGGNAGGLLNAQQYLRGRGLTFDSKKLTILFGVLLIFSLFLFLKQSKILLLQRNNLFLFAFFLYMSSELFVVGFRAGYNTIEWLFACFIMLMAGNKNIVVTVLLGLGIGFMCGWPFTFSHQNEMGELIVFCVLADFVFFHKISAPLSNEVYD